MANKPMSARLMVGESLEQVREYVKDSALLYVELRRVLQACDSPAKYVAAVHTITDLLAEHGRKHFYD